MLALLILGLILVALVALGIAMAIANGPKSRDSRRAWGK